MQMYRCEHCGVLFDEDELQHYSARFDERYAESWRGCPECKSDEYEDVFECEICGEYDTAEQYCNGCRKRVRGLFLDFVAHNLNEDEYDLLNKMLGDDDI